jgi:effector-binding domain-containing protein
MKFISPKSSTQRRKVRRVFTISSFYLMMLFSISSCSNSDEASFGKKANSESINTAATGDSIILQKPEQMNDTKGMVGIFEVPEMLTLCIKDSANEKQLALKYAQAFTTLENELKTLNIKSSGAPGSITYNNDPNNFIFECVYPIGKIPDSQPKNSQVVVLEKSNMLIYNYFGEYAYLHTAYEEIRKIISQNKLVQNGPMREFYITDPSREKDSTKWLTRIMVPVEKK